MWPYSLKEAGVSIHVIATGAGAGIINQLWSVPGSSAYLSGYSFPYAPEEQQELLGFMPEHFCSQEAAIDLASAAYMKAYKFGGKKPVGVGLTATVASEQEHHGGHRVYACIITDSIIDTYHYNLFKGKGELQRKFDGETCDDLVHHLISDGLGLKFKTFIVGYQDATELARSQFFKRPFFTAYGKRIEASSPHEEYSLDHTALMSGAFNPPHDGHFGIVDAMWRDHGMQVVFETTANPPHKAALTVQELLKRAKLLQGHDRLFTQDLPLYLDKARAFPGVPLVMGADAALRLLDPKWGQDPVETFREFDKLGTMLYIVGRNIDGKFVNRDSIWDRLPSGALDLYAKTTRRVKGEWDISSTELRNKVI
jgi:nicotinamide mononucleotide (NMN) deamidase PncC